MDKELLEKYQEHVPDVIYYKDPATDNCGVAEVEKNVWQCDTLQPVLNDADELCGQIQIYGTPKFYNDIHYDGEVNILEPCLCNYRGQWGFALILDGQYWITGTVDKEQWEFIRDRTINEWTSYYFAMHFNSDVVPSCNECDEYHIETFQIPIDSVMIRAIEECDKQFGGPVPQEYIDEEKEARQRLLD